jgi:uncharacterized protein (DUF1697 family)
MMSVFVALLRGINVGNAKRVSMSALRECIEALGYKEVRTLLNSGNVVFSATRVDPVTAACRIEEAIQEKLGVSSRVMVLTAAQLSDIMSSNPLAELADNPSRMLVGILAQPLDRKKLSEIAAANWEPERFVLGKSIAVFAWMPDGVIKSRLNAAVSRSMGDGITFRNSATMAKLVALARSAQTE